MSTKSRDNSKNNLVRVFLHLFGHIYLKNTWIFTVSVVQHWKTIKSAMQDIVKNLWLTCLKAAIFTIHEYTTLGYWYNHKIIGQTKVKSKMFHSTQEKKRFHFAKFLFHLVQQPYEDEGSPCGSRTHRWEETKIPQEEQKCNNDFSIFMTFSGPLKNKQERERKINFEITALDKKVNTNSKFFFAGTAHRNWNFWGIQWVMKNKNPRLIFFVRQVVIKLDTTLRHYVRSSV